MTASARDWLIAGAPGASGSAETLAGMCARLVAEGVQIVRADAYVRTLHPLFAGRGFTWDHGGTRVSETQHEADLGAASSPLRVVFETGRAVRHRLADVTRQCGFLRELLALDATEMIALPLRFTTGDVHSFAVATDRPGGFTPADIAAIEGIVEPLARMAEVLAMRRTAANVLDAYVGRDAGARVLAGKIRRGDTELIEAAIWFSDMRGFSTVSNQLDARAVIELLNELFDCQVPAIEVYGGEVLKFMGDGALAIFAPRPGGGLGDCCAQALAAARQALATLAARNAATPVPLRFGIALHVGEVAYGNIGGAARLDFTAIGRAVNLAARLEGLTATTGHDVLASAAFAQRCGTPAERLGAFALKGFEQPVEAFALR